MDMAITAVTPAMALAVLLALAIDRLWGEPPATWHPVVWMGHYLDAMGKHVAPHAPVHGTAAARVFVLGALTWSAGALLVVLATLAACALITPLHWAAQALVMGFLLKPLLAWRMLHDEVKAVEEALGESLEAGRARLAWLVSRDVAALDAGQVRESAIESLAENLNDSVIAPLFWFCRRRLAWRCRSTVLPIRPMRCGATGARARDATGTGPASGRHGRTMCCPGRLRASPQPCCAWPVRRAVLRLVAAEARLTPSPNSGWPMAAMALMLNIRLGKPGIYTLHAKGRSSLASDTAQALRLANRAVGVLAWAALAALIAASVTQGAI